MRLLKAYRFRLEPTPTVARGMGRVAGCCRFVFNRGLALERERFERKEKHLGYALQQVLKDLDPAYRNFFEGRADLPRFKKKGGVPVRSLRPRRGCRCERSAQHLSGGTTP